MSRTGDDLLTGLKRRGVIPSSQSLLMDSDFLGIADDIIRGLLVPLILSLREEYFVSTPETEALVVGQEEYDIPYRAIGRTLRDLKLIDGSTRKNMTLISLEDEHLFTSYNTPNSFYFRGDKIVVVPTPTATGYSLQKWYDLVPSRICTVSQAAIVQSISTDSVVCTNVPTTITTGTCIDFIQAKSGSSILGMDATITNQAGNQLDFSTGIVPSTLVAGDYISICQTSPVIMLPEEAYPLLETLTCQQILRSIGDFEGATALDATAEKQEKLMKLMMEPRVQGEEKKIVNRNGLLRGARSRFRYGWLVR